jgi:hypothetical protein
MGDKCSCKLHAILTFKTYLNIINRISLFIWTIFHGLRCREGGKGSHLTREELVYDSDTSFSKNVLVKTSRLKGK